MKAIPKRRAWLSLAALAIVAVVAGACSGGGPAEVDDGALWSIDKAVDVGFAKVESLGLGSSGALEAWSGTFNGAHVELYRLKQGPLGLGKPIDPTWLHRRTQAEDCCNFFQRNRLLAICQLKEQACKQLREALEARYPV